MVVFQSEESGFAVVALRPEGGGSATVAGKLAPVHAGEWLTLHGDWREHPRFGRQFQAQWSEHGSPTTVAGLERYLAGELAPRERETVEQHLAGCDQCTRFGGAYAGVSRDLRELLSRPEPVSEDVRERLRRRLDSELAMVRYIAWAIPSLTSQIAVTSCSDCEITASQINPDSRAAAIVAVNLSASRVGSLPISSTRT